MEKVSRLAGCLLYGHMEACPNNGRTIYLFVIRQKCILEISKERAWAL